MYINKASQMNLLNVLISVNIREIPAPWFDILLGFLQCLISITVLCCVALDQTGDPAQHPRGAALRPGGAE